MTNMNDQKILELKKQIEEKKKQIKSTPKFVPLTNCSIEINSIRYNIHTLNKESLINLLVKLNSYMLSAKDLCLLEDYTICGYNINDWISDLKSKLYIIMAVEEENKLKKMETKLSQMLSEEKKVQLELDEIEQFLKE